MYKHTHEIDLSATSASLTVPVLLRYIKRPISSVLDVGGGSGSWSKALLENGVEHLELRDVEEVRPFLLIPQKFFSPTNLELSCGERKRVDLVVCLEVAEHLTFNASMKLVEFITTCSDLVLFSAAPPGQGGVGHINLNTFRFWESKFKLLGFYPDNLFVCEIAGNQQIAPWYRQNLCLFSKVGITKKWLPEDMVLMHESVYINLVNPSFSVSLRNTYNAFRRAIRLRMSRERSL
jgi:hypothetical protein